MNHPTAILWPLLSLFSQLCQLPFFFFFFFFLIEEKPHWYQRWNSGKESTCQCRRRKRLRFNPWDPSWVCSLGQKDPLEKEITTHCNVLAWKSHGQKSLAGYSPWSQKEPDKTEHLSSHTHTHTLMPKPARSTTQVRYVFNHLQQKRAMVYRFCDFWDCDLGDREPEHLSLSLGHQQSQLWTLHSSWSSCQFIHFG